MVTPHCALRRPTTGPLCTNVAVAIASWLRVSKKTLEPLASQTYVCDGCLGDLRAASLLMRVELDVRPLREPLQHAPMSIGGPCRRCGLRYSPKISYVACFEEGDTLETWMARQHDETLAAMPEGVTRAERERRARAPAGIEEGAHGSRDENA
jgi:hypothetical protein